MSVLSLWGIFVHEESLWGQIQRFHVSNHGFILGWCNHFSPSRYQKTILHSFKTIKESNFNATFSSIWVDFEKFVSIKFGRKIIFCNFEAPSLEVWPFIFSQSLMHKEHKYTNVDFQTKDHLRALIWTFGEAIYKQKHNL